MPRHKTGGATGILTAAFVMALVPATAAPQGQSGDGQRDVAATPIHCWWKTDRSAVHIGERFSLALTCAVVDTPAVKVEVDETVLDPATLHLVPFEVLGGQHYRDIWNGDRRFFQYQYDMRLIGEDFFGKDVILPRLEMTYRVQNSVVGGSALAGREQRYQMPAEPIRVESLVARDISDIRDAPPGTFGDIEARIFRANVMLVVAGLSFGLAVLMLLAVVLRAARKHSKKAATHERTLPAALVLRAASKELGAVQALSQTEGWSGDLAGRAATALRLAGAVALSHKITHTPVAFDVKAREGQIVLTTGWRKKMALSAGVTPLTGSHNGRSTVRSPRVKAVWESLGQVLGVFTAVRYGRNGHLDTTALDNALAESRDLLGQLRRHYWWPFTGTGPAGPASTGGTQLWAR